MALESVGKKSTKPSRSLTYSSLRILSDAVRTTAPSGYLGENSEYSLWEDMEVNYRKRLIRSGMTGPLVTIWSRTKWNAWKIKKKILDRSYQESCRRVKMVFTVGWSVSRSVGRWIGWLVVRVGQGWDDSMRRRTEKRRSLTANSYSAGSTH